MNSPFIQFVYYICIIILNLNGMYNRFIADEKEVLVFVDAEIYQREQFFEVFSNYVKVVAGFEGYLVFDGSFSESIMGDFRPRTTLFIFKWPSIELFYRWWNSSQNFRLKQDLIDSSDLKITLVSQNSKNNKYFL